MKRKLFLGAYSLPAVAGYDSGALAAAARQSLLNKVKIEDILVETVMVDGESIRFNVEIVLDVPLVNG